MARKYISFLGTTDYLACTYFLGNREVRNVRFIQEATLELSCREWSAGDRILIFTTQEAERINWLDDGHVDRTTGSRLRREGLKNRIEGIRLSPTLERVLIPEGRSEDEVWDIFESIFARLDQGDEVVFDITHGFRSIPMLAIVVLNYAKALKDIKVRGIYYGALEAIGNPQKAASMAVEERRAPIFDLTAFDSLLDWTIGVDRFIGGGDASSICELTEFSLNPILRDTKGQDRAAESLRKAVRELAAFSSAITTCRATEIGKKAISVARHLNEIGDSRLIKPLEPLLSRIGEHVSCFTGDPVRDGLAAVRWCVDHNLVQQGFTVLQETLITYFVCKGNGDHLNQRHREIAAQGVHILRKNLIEDEWHDAARSHPDLTRGFMAAMRQEPDLVNVFETLSGYRNDLNHAGYRPQPASADMLRIKLREIAERVEGQMN
ncbi:MAG: TIGR02221 family CRISPR-associated protein [Pseudomonadota bacterium]